MQRDFTTDDLKTQPMSRGVFWTWKVVSSFRRHRGRSMIHGHVFESRLKYFTWSCVLNLECLW